MDAPQRAVDSDPITDADVDHAQSSSRQRSKAYEDGLTPPKKKHLGAQANLAQIEEVVSANAATLEEIEEDRRKCHHEMIRPQRLMDQENDGVLAPTDSEPPPPVPTEPSTTFNFELDPFQRTAIDCIDNNESVIVAAHTSAGKTVVAIYAIATALQRKQRVIYTSPIKALSNQKFRDLQAEFKDVGLLTGDVTLSPDASCLVVTTEVLRSMLYNRSEILGEVSWVVYDEVHYMRDKERGFVWEESMILLSSSVRFVFLSATIPNAREFAQWIANLHQQPCHVVYTGFRPVPLQHYIYPTGASVLYMVVNERGQFLEDNFKRAISSLLSSARRGLESSSSRPSPSKNTANVLRDAVNLVHVILQHRLHPAIIFSFSKKSCENLVNMMGRMNCNTEAEMAFVDKIFAQAVGRLSEADRHLPQIENILPVLRRGIGIHHSGLLPLLKEMVEMLFQEGLIKVLFATETFSIGLNMPAKTAVFTSLRKFDGWSFRFITSGEFIQMSGRAGRRGIDDRGLVIMMIDEQIEPALAKAMLYGQSDPLNSSFRITYNMVLNTLRGETIPPQAIIQASFLQFQHATRASMAKENIVETQRKLDQLRDEDSPIDQAMISCIHARRKFIAHRRALQALLAMPEFILPYLKPGRLVYLIDVTKKLTNEDDLDDIGWGIYLHHQTTSSGSIILDVLLIGSSPENALGPRPMPGHSIRFKNLDEAVFGAITLPTLVLEPSEAPTLAKSKERGTSYDQDQDAIPYVFPANISSIFAVSPVVVDLPLDLCPIAAKRISWKRLKRVISHYGPRTVGCLNPFLEMGVSTEAMKDFKQMLQYAHMFHKMLEKIEELTRGTEAADTMTNGSDELDSVKAPVSISPYLSQELRDGFRVALQREMLKEEIVKLNVILESSDPEQATLHEELVQRLLVLRDLGYINEDHIVNLKGQITCELHTGNELIISELIFEGFFNNLDPAQTAALLSCFVGLDGSSDSKPTKIRSSLNELYNRIVTTVSTVFQIEKRHNIPVELDMVLRSIQPGLIEPVYNWAKGMSFRDVCKTTTVFEGSIVRALRRLEELLRQLGVAADVMGNIQLKTQFEDSINAIHRDIVFTSSLYV